MRALQRLVALVDYHMQAIGGAKMSLPILTPASQWKTSGIDTLRNISSTQSDQANKELTCRRLCILQFDLCCVQVDGRQWDLSCFA